MDVDYWGVVNGTKAFLPHLIASGDGHVVNVSSVFGLFSVPGQAAYNAAKFAVRGFTEALRQEMMLAGHPVAVTTVHPGGIKTAIARNATAAEGLDRERAGQDCSTSGWPAPARSEPPGSSWTPCARSSARVLVGTGRQDPGHRGAADRLGLSAAVFERHAPGDASRQLSMPSAAQRVIGQPSAGHRLRVRTTGYLAAHVGQGPGVQHAGDFVERQQLPIASAHCADTAAPHSRPGSARVCRRPAPPDRRECQGRRSWSTRRSADPSAVRPTSLCRQGIHAGQAAGTSPPTWAPWRLRIRPMVRPVAAAGQFAQFAAAPSFGGGPGHQ